MKKYKTGFCIGRFQMLTIKHEEMINLGLSMCDKFLVVVGSAQLEGVERNPFHVYVRTGMIYEVFQKEIYHNKLNILPLDDLTHEDDVEGGKWGKYLMDTITKHIGSIPEIMIYGNDEKRYEWFNPEDIPLTSQLIIPRQIENGISATKLRKLIIEGNKEEWIKYVNPKLYQYYGELRRILLDIKNGDYFKK